MAGPSSAEEWDLAPAGKMIGNTAVKLRSSKGGPGSFTGIWTGLETTQGRGQVDIIRVATTSRPTAVAGAIAASVRESNEAKVQAIGPQAVNQAVKSIAVARGYLALDGLTVVVVPSFIEVAVDGSKRTAMRFLVEPR